MKAIQKEEIYEHISGFLKTRGIELKDGSYTRIIHSSCKVLADAINLGQQGIHRAKSRVDTRLDRVRQVIHEKTAPKKAAASSAPKAKSPSTSAADGPGPWSPPSQENPAAHAAAPASAPVCAEVGPTPAAAPPQEPGPKAGEQGVDNP